MARRVARIGGDGAGRPAGLGAIAGRVHGANRVAVLTAGGEPEVAHPRRRHPGDRRPVAKHLVPDDAHVVRGRIPAHEELGRGDRHSRRPPGEVGGLRSRVVTQACAGGERFPAASMASNVQQYFVKGFSPPSVNSRPGCAAASTLSPRFNS